MVIFIITRATGRRFLITFEISLVACSTLVSLRLFSVHRKTVRMLMKHLYTGRKKSDLIVVKDNLFFNGFVVLKKFIEEARIRKSKVHLLLTERNSLCNMKECENLVIHRLFLDPWNLLSGRETELTFEQIIECILSERTISHGVEVLLVICSLSSLLRMISLETLCTSLKNLRSDKKEESLGIQVLSLLHSELHPEESRAYKHIMYLTSSIITLVSNCSRQVDVEYHQSNGKIIKETYTCGYNSKKELEFEVKNDKPIGKVEDLQEKVINTTFKLTLEEKEKESRNQVILPYLKTSSTNTKGKIYYEPDVNDDWDDEDPDDDLEI